MRLALHLITLSLALGTLALPAPARGAEAPVIRVGLAQADITPPVGIPLAGYYHERGATGILDPLFCKALLLECEGQRVALVTLDLISVTRETTDRARAEIERATGIPGEYVMIAATHAHTGPELAQSGRRNGEPGAKDNLVVAFTEGLPARIAATVRLAGERLEAAQLSAARARCEGLTFNRRYYLRDGSVGWNPGKLNPDIVLPAGPTDPEVGLLLVEKAGASGPREVLATCVNFAMHTDTTGGTKFSADWPGALSRVLAGYHGADHVTLVTLGACGNLNHLDFAWRWPQGTPIEQHRIATILGATIFQAHKELQPVAPGPLRAKSVVVELAVPEVTPEQVAEARATLAAVKDDRGPNFMKQVRAYRVLDLAARAGRPFRVEVQGLALGDQVAWISLPGEVFVELGLALKKRSPFLHTQVIELANEDIGYIPDRRSYAEGNYEPESARCAPGSGERLVEAAVRLLQELHAPRTP
jgi:hypothetical protein